MRGAAGRTGDKQLGLYDTPEKKLCSKAVNSSRWPNSHARPCEFCFYTTQSAVSQQLAVNKVQTLKYKRLRVLLRHGVPWDQAPDTGTLITRAARELRARDRPQQGEHEDSTALLVTQGGSSAHAPSWTAPEREI